MAFGVYGINGIRYTIVSGAARTGLFAADGSFNVVVDDATYQGLYHPCGALRTSSTYSANQLYDASGAYYLNNLFGKADTIGTFTQNVTSANTSAFQSTYRAGARNTRVAFIGDSTFRGQSTGGGVTQAINSFPMQLAGLLIAANVNAGANNVWGDGGSWGLAQTISNLETGDNRITHTLAWGLGSVLSAGGNSFAATAAGGMNFTPQANVNTMDIIWRDGATGRDFTWGVDGGATTLVQSTNVTQFGGNTTGLALGSVASHTINLAWSAGNVNILGINAYDNTRKELSLWNWGICGGTSANMINNTDTAVGRLAILANANYKPDLAFIECGFINDWRNSVAVATSKSNLALLVQTCLDNGTNVILAVPVFDSGVAGLTAQQQTYVDAMYQVAYSKNVGIIDVRRRIPALAASDTVHLTAAGYLAEAGLYRDLILRLL